MTDVKNLPIEMRAAKFRSGASTLILAAWLTTGGAMAQDFKQVAPNEPAPNPGASVTMPKPAAAPQAEHKLLLPALKGLRFVASAQQIARAGTTAGGLTVDGPALTLLNDPAMEQALSAFIGKPLYIDDLPKISQLVLGWYRDHDMPVVDVTFPEQDISGGTVQALVSVYRLGQIKIEGNNWFGTDVLRQEVQSPPGQPIELTTLKSDLNRLNRNPFRQVNAVLARSETVGSTDLVLRVEDRMPARFYASYDNNGLPAAGRDRYSIGFNWGNAFGLDHQLSYSFLTSPDLWGSRSRGAGHSGAPRLSAHSLNYLAPLPSGDFVNVFASYVEQVPNLGPFFDQVGHSFQLGLRYEFALDPIWDMSQQLRIGFDYKRSDNNIAFGGTQIFGNATNVEQFLAIYGLTRPDSWGQTAVTNQFVFSPGGLSDGNRTAVFVASGSNGAKAGYVYDNLQITRVTYLPEQLSLVARFDAQIASAELLPSEQLGAGGADSVRGYDPRVFNASQGFLASLELRSPTYHPLQGIDGLGVDDAAQFLVFYDSAFVSDLNAQAVQPKSATLQSVGLGLRYGIGRYADLSLDYGWQLNKAPGATRLGDLMSLSLTVAY